MLCMSHQMLFISLSINNPAMGFPSPYQQLHWSYLIYHNLFLLFLPSHQSAEVPMGTITGIAFILTLAAGEKSHWRDKILGKDYYNNKSGFDTPNNVENFHCYTVHIKVNISHSTSPSHFLIPHVLSSCTRDRYNLSTIPPPAGW